jgi:hypothetical protein
MYLLSIITKLFHFLPEEVSHHLALGGLKFLHRFGFLNILLGKRINDIEILKKPNDVLTYKNKLGIAAGLDKNGEYSLKLEPSHLKDNTAIPNLDCSEIEKINHCLTDWGSIIKAFNIL